MGNYLEGCSTWVERLEMKDEGGRQFRGMGHMLKDCALIEREHEMEEEELHCEEVCEQEEEERPSLETEGRCVKALGVEEAGHARCYLYSL